MARLSVLDESSSSKDEDSRSLWLCGRVESDERDDVATRRTRPDEEDRTGQCVVALRKQSCSIERVCLDPIDLPEI